MVGNTQIILVGVFGIIALVVFFLVMLLNSRRSSLTRMGKDKEQRSEIETPNSEKYAELFLRAVLTEYKVLRDEIVSLERGVPIILSVLIGGIATIISLFETIGVFALLLIPIFTSVCVVVAIINLSAIYFIAIYIKKEIERKKLSKVFPLKSLPITWEHYNERHGKFWGTLFMGLFGLFFFLCIGCLSVVSLAYWNEVEASIFLLLVYIFGWCLTIACFASVLYLFRSLQEYTPRFE